MTQPNIIGTIVGASICLLALFAWGGTMHTNPTLKQTTSSDGALATGPENAPIVVIAYTDFQCPACAALHPVLKQLTSEYNGQVRLIHRHFPLAMHEHAQLAAQASEAAAAQGKFWEMYDMLFTHQNDWEQAKDPMEQFRHYAHDLNIDVANFVQFIENKKGEAAIMRDIQTGEEAGVSSTPTLFINGQGFSGVPSYKLLKYEFDAILALKQAGQASPSPR